MADHTTNSQKLRFRNGAVLILVIVMALVAFEAFNYSTTEFALADLLGSLKFAGIAWSTILSIAFCGIDFAGIARLLVPETANQNQKEAWYLFAAWLLAATMNAILTWWGVSMAIMNHAPRSSSVVDALTLTKIVPVFVAVMVLVIRVLIIGTLSTALQRFVQMERPGLASTQSYTPIHRSLATQAYPRTAYTSRAAEQEEENTSGRNLEPVYKPIMAKSGNKGETLPAPTARFGRKL